MPAIRLSAKVDCSPEFMTGPHHMSAHTEHTTKRHLAPVHYTEELEREDRVSRLPTSPSIARVVLRNFQGLAKPTKPYGSARSRESSKDGSCVDWTQGHE